MGRVVCVGHHALQHLHFAHFHDLEVLQRIHTATFERDGGTHRIPCHGHDGGELAELGCGHLSKAVDRTKESNLRAEERLLKFDVHQPQGVSVRNDAVCDACVCGLMLTRGWYTRCINVSLGMDSR